MSSAYTQYNTLRNRVRTDTISRLVRGESAGNMRVARANCQRGQFPRLADADTDTDTDTVTVTPNTSNVI